MEKNFATAVLLPIVSSMIAALFFIFDSSTNTLPKIQSRDLSGNNLCRNDDSQLFPSLNCLIYRDDCKELLNNKAHSSHKEVMLK